MKIEPGRGMDETARNDGKADGGKETRGSGSRAQTADNLFMFGKMARPLH